MDIHEVRPPVRAVYVETHTPTLIEAERALAAEMRAINAMLADETAKTESATRELRVARLAWCRRWGLATGRGVMTPGATHGVSLRVADEILREIRLVSNEEV